MGNGLAKLAAKKRLRIVGLMSGTSADGIDAAIVDISDAGVKCRAFATYPYPASVRREIFALFDPQTARIDRLCHMNFLLGELFASAVIRLAEASGIALRSIDLVGSHGQTVYHIPKAQALAGRQKLRSTLQIGEPSVIAERTGITTIADFRPRDIAAGGEGAPLVPLTDWILFGHRQRTRALQNIGGIANVTFLPAGARREDILAFDTGPGNMIMDRITQRITHGKQAFDGDGRLAAQGQVREDLLGPLLRDAYFRLRPPKSTGRERFGAQTADGIFDGAVASGIAPRDILATVTAFTARSIADAYRRFLPAQPQEVILCGGGARNATLRGMLAAALAPARVRVMDELGINADAKEAISFAILAYQTIRGRAGNAPTATGAGQAVVLGKIVPGR